MTDSLIEVPVDLPGRPYRIAIAAGLLGRVGGLLRDLLRVDRATIVTDETVGPLYFDRLATSLRAAGVEPDAITLPAGEATKSLRQLGKVYDELAARPHERGDPVIAMGGGVVGDLAGLAAATWHRGVPFVQCPTTLEADIDAGIGGKTAINHPAGKNLIGAFHQPAMVCIDPDCLATLPKRDFIAGLAESVKHAAIGDPAFLSWHEAHADAILDREPAILAELIRRNCRIKAAVVVEDERESGAGGVGRAALNFGHTAGHALEVLSGFDLRHGEAVSLGMVVAMDLAVALAGFSNESRDRIEAILQRLGLPTRLSNLPPLELMAARMQQDKKSRRRAVRFVLLDKLGSVVWCESASSTALESALGRLTLNERPA